MGDQTKEIFEDQTQFAPDQDKVQEITLFMSEENLTNRIEETSSSNEEQKKLILTLEKIESLNEKIQVLKKEHMALVEEVKSGVREPFPGSDVSSALQLLGIDHERLKKKFVEESLERKRLYNAVIELKGNIRVFCRCRPLNQEEITSGSSSVVNFDPSRETELQITCADSSKKQFKFDHVFGPQDNQQAVFSQTAPVVVSVLDGFNVCIFAYGQTGTGKTFTMEGTPESRGVNYRTLEELFRISMERNATMKYELFVSMLEVYNEKIRDLLVENSNQPAKKLEIKQGAEGTQEVPGLVEARVYSTDEVWDLLKTGSRIRAVGSTNANELSSRSHCLLRVTVKGENLVNRDRTRSHLWLVDLAGSERVGRIDVVGERLKESQFINKSLSSLGDVISALASKTSHIPYRNSKLTHLLQSSLGGDCKTLMFVQISPSSTDLGETICSLNFATRVRGIEHGPVRKQADPSELFKYKQMAEKFRHDEKETKKLQDSLQSLQLRFAAREQLCRNLQEKVRDLENQLADERKTRLQQETRACAASARSSSFSYMQPVHKGHAETKPPLCPSKPRAPLRGITNILPPAQCPSRKTASAFPALPTISGRKGDKENISGTVTITNTKARMGPRRVSIAVRPPPTTTTQVQKPRRRVSIATLHPESHSLSLTPLNKNTSNQPKNGSMMPQRSFARDQRRVSRIFSPLELSSQATGEATPAASRSKFMGSPPIQQLVGSWKPKHPTVVALQRRHFVWSPLKQKTMKNERRSLQPSRFDYPCNGLEISSSHCISSYTPTLS